MDHYSDFYECGSGHVDGEGTVAKCIFSMIPHNVFLKTSLQMKYLHHHSMMKQSFGRTSISNDSQISGIIRK